MWSNSRPLAACTVIMFTALPSSLFFSSWSVASATSLMKSLSFVSSPLSSMRCSQNSFMAFSSSSMFSFLVMPSWLFSLIASSRSPDALIMLCASVYASADSTSALNGSISCANSISFFAVPLFTSSWCSTGSLTIFHAEIWLLWALASTLFTVVSPMPLAGTFMILLRASSSLSFSTRRM